MSLDKSTRSRGRPPVISTERLLDVARQVFLERGIRATTAEVAERAGVSEGTVFHRFKSKDALFRAAMGFDPESAVTPVEPFLERAGKGDLRATLVEMAATLLEKCRVALPMMMMSWSNPSGEYALDKMMIEPPAKPTLLVDAIRSFFEIERRAGRIEHQKPDILARVLMGSVQHYCFLEIFYPRRDGASSPSEFVNALVDLLLRGAGGSPADLETTSRKRRRIRRSSPRPLNP